MKQRDAKSSKTHKIVHRGRFAEILDYVGFTKQDVVVLRRIFGEIGHEFPSVVDRFYEAHQSNRHTANIFDGPEQIARLQSSFTKWLAELFTEDRDLDYCQHRWVIGEVHVSVGLNPQFMFGAMNIVRSSLFKLMNENDLMAHWISVERALDIDLMIMVQSYWDYVTDIKLKTPFALASGMAHEIRNPLNSIVLNLSLLERSGNFTEKERDICASLQSEIERIKKTMTEMIDFTRPIDLVCRSFPSAEMEKSLRYQFQEELSENDIIVAFEHSADEVLVFGDFDRLKQVLINLIQNAANAIGKEGRILISFKQKRRGSEIWVLDDGPGMKGKDMLRMWELFYTTRAEGTGLGLPIVKQIIESHEGSIDATSSRAGTRFVIQLPEKK